MGELCIGGAFIDAVLIDGAQVWTAAKAPTSADVGGGVLAACSPAAERAGAVLVRAPDDWTDGCCTLDEADVAANGFSVIARAYLDPLTGLRLYEEILLPDGVRAFATRPRRWADASSSA